MDEETKRTEMYLQKYPPVVRSVLREALNRKRHFGRVLTDRELKQAIQKEFRNDVDV